MDLTDKRILVTGGAGFIGSHVIDLLLQEEVRAITAVDNMVRGRRSNLHAALRANHVRLVEGDITDRDLLESLVADCDVVFHMSALRITQCADEPRAAMESMGMATFDLLERCVAHKVEKVICSSSASIYGMADTFPTGEDHHPYDNRTLYGALKSFNEGLLRSFNEMYGLAYVALRYFNAYGTRMDIHGRYTEVLVRWMDRIRNGESPVIFGDGHQTMDFVNVRDIARANILAAKSDEQDAVFNVASGIETSLRELADALLRVMRSDLAPSFGPERAVNPVPRRLADISAAEDCLGFRAEIGLDQGLRELVDWWQAERAGVEAVP